MVDFYHRHEMILDPYNKLYNKDMFFERELNLKKSYSSLIKV